MNQIFLGRTVFYDKKKFWDIFFWVFWKKLKKKIFPKNRAPGKTEISREPRYFFSAVISGTFFRVSFLKFNSLQIYVKKLTFWTLLCVL